MKFAHEYDDFLRKEEYPRAWLNSAIQYRQLKKCIKRVQRELHSLGLDPQMLEQLWQDVENGCQESTVSEPNGEGSVRYYPYCVSIGCSTFKPKLTVAVNPRDGSLMDAWLSSETLDFLRRLSESLPTTKTLCEQSSFSHDQHLTQEEELSIMFGDVGTHAKLPVHPRKPLETVDIPLTSDSEFFRRLHLELRDLSQLQQAEEQRLSFDIDRLGQCLTALTQGKSRKSRTQINVWREIFQRYIESDVFFSRTGRGKAPRPAAVVQERLELFDKFANQEDNQKHRKPHHGSSAVDSFLQINHCLLRFHKFQEINRIALTKIMKKFEKRTALHAQATSDLPLMLMQEPFISQNIAKATCFTIQERLFSTIPQLNDYLCPVCYSIAYKPVRLSCDHIFCIRCLLIMQESRQGQCPLCRGAVVMEASPEHLDIDLMTFLRAKFPDEVKVKQKENERAVAIDLYGGVDNRCTVM